MPSTYEPIATTTLSSAAATINFSSIPSTYTDLKVVVVAFTVTGFNTAVWYRFNSNTGTNYSTTILTAGNGGAISLFTANDTKIQHWDVFAESSAPTIPVFSTLDVFSYTGSTNKTCLVLNSGDRNGAGGLDVIVGLWRNTSAITSLQVIATSSNFGIGTTATLYGIKNA